MSEQEIRRQRKTLDRVLDRQSMRPVERAFDDGVGSIIRRVGGAVRGGRRLRADSPAIMRVSSMAEKGIEEMFTSMGAELSAATAETLTESIRQLGRFARRMSGRSTVLDDEIVVRRIIREHQRAIEEARLEVMQRLGRRAQDAVRRSVMLAEIGEESVSDVIARAEEAIDKQWSAVQRLVKTETNAAFNLARAEGIAALAAEDRRIKKRWTELVDDATGQPLDDKVAQDSIVLHGQVASPGRAFVMPPDRRAPPRMIGMRWMHPPNRPNDRAVLLPWLPEWGIPGWQWSGGRRRRIR